MIATLPSASPPSRAGGNPETLSAKNLHGLLRKTYRLGARVRLRFLGLLLALDRGRLHAPLGYPSTAAYAAKHFGWGRSQTFGALRVAGALEELPTFAAAYSEGRLPWSSLREITRIADPDTEAVWLDFALRKTVEEVKAEVADALQKGRKKPRNDRYGLPHLRTRVSFELEPQDHALVAQALERVGAEMAGGLDRGMSGERVRPRDALVFLSKMVLEKGLPDTPGDGGAGDTGTGDTGTGDTGTGDTGTKSLYGVLYRVCPDCRTSHVSAPELGGFVEVPEEVVARVEGEADRVTIDPQEELRAVGAGASEEEASGESFRERDRPNPRALVRKVRARDGDACANPHCGERKGLHAHHIRFRSGNPHTSTPGGGRTELWNEVLLCSRCHALVHLGFLEVSGDPAGQLEWNSASDKLTPSTEEVLAEEAAELSSLPAVQIQGLVSGQDRGVESTRVDSLLPLNSPLSTRVDSRLAGARRFSVIEESDIPHYLHEFEPVIKALEALGYEEKEATTRFLFACDELRQRGQWLTYKSTLNGALRIRFLE